MFGFRILGLCLCFHSVVRFPGFRALLTVAIINNEETHRSFPHSRSSSQELGGAREREREKEGTA
jgi:hypothetical protein